MVSQSSLNLNSFLSEAIENQRVWTFRDENGFPAPQNSEGNRAMPFWSTLSRVQTIINSVDSYQTFEPFEISLHDFMQKWLPGLENDDLLVGINWSGKRVTGYDLKGSELLSIIHKQSSNS